MNARIELISTGTELLDGRSVNLHAQILAQSLREIGLSLACNTTVPDDEREIADALKAALSRSEGIFIGGGLGPTSDDVTREAVASVLDRKIERDEREVEALRKRLAALGRSCSAVAEKQVDRLEGAELLPNPCGFAPGQWLELDRQWLVLLPGPPEEFRAILHDHVIPRLKIRYSPPPVFSRTFDLCGIGESAIAEALAAKGLPPDGIKISYRARPGHVELRVSGTDAATVEEAARQIRQLLRDNIYSEEGLPMEAVVGRLLLEKKATLAVAESCTGGLLGGRITSQPGSSQYFVGGVVCYSNEAKIKVLGIPPEILEHAGAVSRPTASAMAQRVRELFGSTYGIGITGIAGPSGGTPEKPVGLVYVAVADAEQTIVQEFRFPPGRNRVRESSVQMALDLLRRQLLLTHADKP